MPLKENAKANILICAGEASGDAYGALLMEQLSARLSHLRFYGAGSSAMKQAGLTPLYDTHTLSVMGIVEVLSIIPTLVGIKKKVLRWAQQHKPSCAVFIDYPGFHVPLARSIKDLGIPVLYYISPKVWAYREKRILKVIRACNNLASIFDFEKELYHRYGCDTVHFVGHPIVDVLNRANALDITPNPQSVGILPGSRNSEISRLLPPMIQAAQRLRTQHPELQFWLSCVDTFPDSYYRGMLNDFDIELRRDNLHCHIASSQAIMAASGTVNLEIAYLGVPAVITYRLAPLTHAIAKRIIKIPYASPVNIIMNGPCYRELLQDLCTPQHIAEEIESLLFNNTYRHDQLKQLHIFKTKLGTPGASKRVAELVINLGKLSP